MGGFKLAELYADITARDQKFNQVMGRTQGSIKRTDGLLGGLVSKAALIGAGLAVAFGGAVKAAMDYEKQMARVSTMLQGDAQKWMPEYTDQVDKMAREFGESTESLSGGLYDLLSASVAPEKAMETLKVATEAAKGGFTSTAVAVDGMTSIMNAYQLEADAAGTVTDKMAMTVAKGKITFEQLSGVVGRVAPMAKAAGENMDTMLGALSGLTRQGLSASEASTRLVAMLRTASKEGTSLMGLVQKYQGQDLASIMGDVTETEAAQGIAALSGDVQGLQGDIEAMANSGGARLEAFEKYQDTFAAKWDKAKAAAGGLFRTLGNLLLPILTPLIQGITTVVNWISDLVGWIKEAVSGNIEWSKTIQGVGEWMSNFLGWVGPLWDQFLSGLAYAWAVCKAVVVNWKTALELAVTASAYHVVKFVNQISHFFGETLPYALGYFGRNWREIFQTAADYVVTVFTNLGENIGNFFYEVWNQLSSGFTEDWNYEWKSLSEGAQNYVKEAFKPPEREAGELEAFLEGRVKSLSAKMANAVHAEYKSLMGTDEEVESKEVKVKATVEEKKKKAAEGLEDVEKTVSKSVTERIKVQMTSLGSFVDKLQAAVGKNYEKEQLDESKKQTTLLEKIEEKTGQPQPVTS